MTVSTRLFKLFRAKYLRIGVLDRLLKHSLYEYLIIARSRVESSPRGAAGRIADRSDLGCACAVWHPGGAGPNRAVHANIELEGTGISGAGPG